jgi:hypothetical protein
MNAARAGFGTLATYATTVFVLGVFLRFATARFPEELWVAAFAFFTRSMVLQ